MKKSILKASGIVLMIASLSLISCEAVKECCGKKSCSTTTSDSAETKVTACSKCGKNSCDKNCSSNPAQQKK